jgi:hypothetical protein
MSRFDETAMYQFWNRIGDVFARRLEAAKSLVLSGTSLVLSAVSGQQLASVNLAGTFATNATAGHSLSISGRTITLKNVNGGSLGGVTVPETSLSGYATQEWVRNNCAFSLDVSGSTSSSVVIYLNNYYGGTLSTVTLNF